MTPDEVVSALSELANTAGIEVRVERFELELAGKGGLCRVGDKSVILVDAKLGALEQAGVIGLSLGKHVRRTRALIDVPPRLKSYLKTGHGDIRPIVSPKPLATTTRLRLVSG
ncbi:hypothetical protein AKJ09_10336 [Labilithrix luteola]|uniref:Uncharacterized protein n=1 Tax=Labilithrix luteola TaxID=1391654 RepID=A0A0K1QD65_9BACT|nr:hypothetical protein [Labilithrix luteola]AKV03673.1 hypothetical protein AKJ09_10336 [Labilithrix luteola]